MSAVPDALVAIEGLLHIAIKTGDLAATRAFYLDVLGMQEIPRPDFGYPDTWLGLPGPGPAGTVPLGTAAVDHVPLTARGDHGFIARLQAHGIAFREFIVPGTPLWQLFAYDPSGVQIELTFDSRREDRPLPDLSPGRAYMAGESFFVPR